MLIELSSLSSYVALYLLIVLFGKFYVFSDSHNLINAHHNPKSSILALRIHCLALCFLMLSSISPTGLSGYEALPRAAQALS